jgi:dienelactone hydrolase
VSGHLAVQQFARERQTISSDDREIEALGSHPIVREQDSGALLMHEAFDVTESVLRLAELIAAAGFIVWVPVPRSRRRRTCPTDRRGRSATKPRQRDRGSASGVKVNSVAAS